MDAPCLFVTLLHSLSLCLALLGLEQFKAYTDWLHHHPSPPFPTSLHFIHDPILVLLSSLLFFFFTSSGSVILSCGSRSGLAFDHHSITIRPPFELSNAHDSSSAWQLELVDHPLCLSCPTPASLYSLSTRCCIAPRGFDLVVKPIHPSQ